MDEITVAKKDSAQGTDQTSDSKRENTSKTLELTPEIKKAISDALAEQGRKHKAELEPIRQERDSLKTQVEQAKKEVKEATTTSEETKGRITELEADLEQAIGEDADLRDINKIKKELRAERDKARQDVKLERDAVAELKKATEAERLEWAETVAEAQVFKFDGELAKVVDEYDGDITANFTKLKNACEKAGVKTKEGAEAIAETFLTKKAEEPPLVLESGVTKGGGTDFSDLSPRKKIELGLQKGSRIFKE